ncbi:hypothetical protein F5B20DRAFT_36297 [Whalleya microplaca]|nr:hypothetical protein F5B20DRAFT_36297 [Whalleya microplaca]
MFSTMDIVYSQRDSIISFQTYLGIGIPLIVLTALFVAIRLWHSWDKKKGLLVEDYLSVVALALLVISFALYIVAIGYAPVLPSDVSPATVFWLRLQITQTISTTFLLFFAKSPLLSLYIRLFKIVRWVRPISYTTISVTGAQLIVSTYLICARCVPDGKVINEHLITDCSRSQCFITFWNGIIAIITNIVLFILPFPIIMNLQLSRRKKTGLAVVFLTGIVGIVSIAVSMIWRVAFFRTGLIPKYILMVTTVIECSIAIIISCVPVIPSFWTDHISNNALYLQIRSVFYPMFSRKDTTSKGPVNALEGLNDCTMNANHFYAELGNEGIIKVGEGIKYGNADNWVVI